MNIEKMKKTVTHKRSIKIILSQLYKYETNKLNDMEVSSKTEEFFKSLDEKLMEYDELNY